MSDRETSWDVVEDCQAFCGCHEDSLDGWNIVQNDLYIYPEGTVETKMPAAHSLVEAAEAQAPGWPLSCALFCREHISPRCLACSESAAFMV